MSRLLTRLNHSFSSLSMMISNTSYEIGPDWSFFRSALTVSSHSWSERGDVSDVSQSRDARGPRPAQPTLLVHIIFHLNCELGLYWFYASQRLIRTRHWRVTNRYSECSALAAQSRRSRYLAESARLP